MVDFAASLVYAYFLVPLYWNVVLMLIYLIFWVVRRGWPESANTWEPAENLKACSDFIDAYEKRYASETPLYLSLNYICIG